MQTYNAITSALFGPLLGWFGRHSAVVDILFWSVLGGIVALLVYKHASNQKGIEKAKNDIKVHLMEIRLFQDDILGVLVSTGKILVKNALYIGHNILPMLIMFVPMMTILFQLEAHYAFDPIAPGSTQVLTVKMDPDLGVPSRDVRLAVPAGVTLDAPPVAAPDAVAFRLNVEQPGDHVLRLSVGGQEFEKGLAVGGSARKVPFLRTKSWEGFLYPGEDPLPADSPIAEIRLAYPERDLGWLPSGEMGILATFFILSLVAGLALKGLFGVTL